MTAPERVATVLMLVPGALWAGVIFFNAVERVSVWARMPIDQYAVGFRRSVHRADPLQPILGVLSVGGAVWFALLVAGGAAAWLAWSAVGCVAVVERSVGGLLGSVLGPSSDFTTASALRQTT